MAKKKYTKVHFARIVGRSDPPASAFNLTPTETRKLDAWIVQQEARHVPNWSFPEDKFLAGPD